MYPLGAHTSEPFKGGYKGPYKGPMKLPLDLQEVWGPHEHEIFVAL